MPKTTKRKPPAKPAAKPRVAGKPAAAPAPAPGLRPHARAKRDRGADTRAQLIEAALDIFGRVGFEGAGTREIAKAAGANLAAIVYHFGGKEKLHLAVAEHVVSSIAGRMGPALASVSDPLTTGTPQTARAGLHRLVGAFIDIILGAAEAERWARFIIREQMQPTAAFDVFYNLLGRGAITTATRLVATALQRPEDEEIRIRVLTFLGQVMIFRVAHALVMRRMNWKAIGETERTHIKRIVIGQIDDILDAEEKA